jgi:dTDP-4-amino-4,6-dideoxygalactose transaminase
MKVPFLNLSIKNQEEKNSILNSINNVLEHGKLVMGPEIEILEKNIANYCSRQYCVTVGSGTDSLYLALRALDLGFGDEVITTSLSWIATANAIALTGAKPVFADINDDLNISIESTRKLITTKTKAILVVNYTGKICDMDEFIKIAKENNLYLIEDGSQSFGAKYKDKICGSFGIISCISHNPMKILAGIGEAGSILCDDKNLYNRLISLRYNGTINRETCIEPSLNARMDTIQAAVLLKRLEKVDEIIYKRRENAKFYIKNLAKFVTVPNEKSFEYDVYYTFIIKTQNRDKLMIFLEENGIETKIQHRELMPHQPAYSKNGLGKFSNGEEIVNKILCLPISENLSKQEIEYVVEVIKKYFILNGK